MAGAWSLCPRRNVQATSAAQHAFSHNRHRGHSTEVKQSVREAYYSLQQRLNLRMSGSLSQLRYPLIMCTVKVLALHFNSLFETNFCSTRIQFVELLLLIPILGWDSGHKSAVRCNPVSLDLSGKMLAWFCPLDFPPLLPPEVARHCYGPLPTSLCLAPRYWQSTAPQI